MLSMGREEQLVEIIKELIFLREEIEDWAKRDADGDFSETELYKNNLEKHNKVLEKFKSLKK
jgi:hypothetical protein